MFWQLSQESRFHKHTNKYQNIHIMYIKSNSKGGRNMDDDLLLEKKSRTIFLAKKSKFSSQVYSFVDRCRSLQREMEKKKN